MIIAVIQARMGSARLPNKTLAHIEGVPLLEHVVNRARAARTVDDVVIATTEQPADQQIVEFAGARGIRVTRGSELDVLDRTFRAAVESQASVVVRVTPDDPFKDPAVIDDLVGEFQRRAPGIDYVSNTIEATYPEGLDIEVIGRPALERAWREAKLPSEREHVTPYIWKQPQRFQVANITREPNLSHLRWTIDYEEDLAFARAVYQRLYAANPLFGFDDVMRLLQTEPWIGEINSTAGRQRNEGYWRSVNAEGAHAADKSGKVEP